MADKNHLILTAVGPDQIGLVEKISAFIARHSCNIEDSKMAVFCGEFALIFRRVETPIERSLFDGSVESVLHDSRLWHNDIAVVFLTGFPWRTLRCTSAGSRAGWARLAVERSSAPRRASFAS